MNSPKGVPSVVVRCANCVNLMISPAVKTVEAMSARAMKMCFQCVIVKMSEKITPMEKLVILGFNPTRFGPSDLKGCLCCLECMTWLGELGTAWHHFECTGHKVSYVSNRQRYNRLKAKH
jgi:hypothetical protein